MGRRCFQVSSSGVLSDERDSPRIEIKAVKPQLLAKVYAVAVEREEGGREYWGQRWDVTDFRSGNFADRCDLDTHLPLQSSSSVFPESTGVVGGTERGSVNVEDSG